jgi:hypothetical protein
MKLTRGRKANTQLSSSFKGSKYLSDDSQSKKVYLQKINQESEKITIQ